MPHISCWHVVINKRYLTFWIASFSENLKMFKQVYRRETRFYITLKIYKRYFFFLLANPIFWRCISLIESDSKKYLKDISDFDNLLMIILYLSDAENNIIQIVCKIAYGERVWVWFESIQWLYIVNTRLYETAQLSVAYIILSETDMSRSDVSGPFFATISIIRGWHKAI